MKKMNHTAKKRRNNLLYEGLVYNGLYKQPTSVQRTVYTEKGGESAVVKEVNRLSPVSDGIQWVHVSGLSDTATIEAICKTYKLPLPLLQDVLNAKHIAKMEETNGLLFAILDAYHYGEDGLLNCQHQAIILGQNWVLSFDEGTENRFDAVNKALVDGVGQVLKHGPDFLFNLLISVIVDTYYEVIEQQQASILDLEDEMMEFARAQPVTSVDIQRQRRDYIRLSKAITPFLEDFGSFLMMDSALIPLSTNLYFRDTYDHLKQVKISLEANREIMASLVDIYLSNNDVRLNRSMNQLTIVGTIFIPLTFLAGVWGMNFKYMPELDWPYGYLLAWLLMIVIGIGLYVWFRRKNMF